MDKYQKSKKFQEKLEICLQGLQDATTSFVVTPGTQLHSILPSALECLRKDGQILWVGCGSGSDKAVECAEATKYRYRGLHQVTQITTKRVEEYWEPTIEGLNTLQVVREIPSIAILLSMPKHKNFKNDQPETYGERVFFDGFDP